MKSKINKILIVAKTEIKSLLRYKFGLVFITLFSCVFIYMYIQQLNNLEYKKIILPFLISYISFILNGIILSSDRLFQIQQDFSLETLLTAPLNISELIFGKTIGVLFLSSSYALIFNILGVIFLVVNKIIFSWLIILMIPLSIFAMFIFSFFCFNITNILQLIWQSAAILKINYFILIGITLFLFYFLEHHGNQIFIIGLIILTLLVSVIILQFWLFNKVIKIYRIT